MRRDMRRNDNEGKGNFKMIMYLSGSVLGIAIITFIITFSLYNNKAKDGGQSVLDTEKIATLVPNNIIENTTVTSSGIGKSVNESKNEVSNTVQNNVTNSTNTTKDTTNKTEKKQTNTTKNNNVTTNNTKKEEKKKDPTFIKPVEGDILKKYAKDELVYSETLQEWVTHYGIDIKADKTTVVKVSSDGTVESIKNDPRYGLTVVIKHDNGYKTVYSNLLTAEFVTENEKVKSGQTLGTVGTSAAFESADEPHLHFEILKDNVNLDPSKYIK